MYLRVAETTSWNKAEKMEPEPSMMPAKVLMAFTLFSFSYFCA